MASQFADAIIGSMISNMSPQVAMEREAVDRYMAQQEKQSLVAQADAVTRVGELLTSAASSGNAEPAVLEAYRKILAKLAE